MRSDLILIKPIITEKSMLAAAHGKFTFAVAKQAEKQQIKDIVESHFKVKIIDISTINVSGKTKKFGRKRNLIKMSDYKKAIVTLKKGQKIDLFDIKESK